MDRRLDAPKERPAHALRNNLRPLRTCCECGAAYEAVTVEATFCSAPCRKAWNNRRAVRGAELYDLFMALRFDRQTATALKVWKLLNRLAAIYRAEDKAERAGRLSWRPPAEILMRRPYLKADVLTAGRRR